MGQPTLFSAITERAGQPSRTASSMLSLRTDQNSFSSSLDRAKKSVSQQQTSRRESANAAANNSASTNHAAATSNSSAAKTSDQRSNNDTATPRSEQRHARESAESRHESSNAPRHNKSVNSSEQKLPARNDAAVQKNTGDTDSDANNDLLAALAYLIPTNTTPAAADTASKGAGQPSASALQQQQQLQLTQQQLLGQDSEISLPSVQPSNLTSQQTIAAQQLMAAQIMPGLKHADTAKTSLGGTAIGSVNAPSSPLPLASGLASTNAATNLPFSTQLYAVPGSTEWQQEMNQQILRFSRQGQHSIQLHLNPKELGPMQVHLTVDKQQAQLQFLANHAQVRDAVQQAIPQLRAALAQQGIALGETMVGQQQQDNQTDDHPSRPAFTTATSATVDIAAATDLPLANTSDATTQPLSGGISLYA